MIDHRPECSKTGICRCVQSKFLNDATYHAFVHRLANVMEEFRYDLDEIQRAAVLANEMYQKRKRDDYGKKK